MRKITVVGPGRVGESTAQNLAKEELCRELVLLGTDAQVAQGIALDIQESAPQFEFDTRVTGGADPALMAGSDLVIVTAGLPRKPGMSRAELMQVNKTVIGSIMDNVLHHAPEAMLLLVTNPVDALTYFAWQRTGWPRQRVLGLSGVLDSARMASFIAAEAKLSIEDVRALVIGGHGDGMVPLPRYSTISGIPITHFLDAATVERVCERTRKGGAEILALKQNASAYDAPAAAIAEMVDAIAHDRRRILPCVAVLEGEYGCRDLAMGVPVVLGAGGVERVIELPLTTEEQNALVRSAAQVRESLS
ncbi:MAG: malate dehydrogenase [Gammaproteobacteria bacterium]|nr:malate dehydrogenase [Gammaproteobacteria bacterium]